MPIDWPPFPEHNELKDAVGGEMSGAMKPVKPMLDKDDVWVCPHCTFQTSKRPSDWQKLVDHHFDMHRRVEAIVPQKEMVNNPAHYGGADNLYEHVKVATAWGLLSNAFLYNCTKYICRNGKKGDALEDLRKAQWYLAREIERLESERG